MKQYLIIEDDTALREGLCISLKTSEVNTHSAGRLSEAYQLLAKYEYDLIILDCNLPDGNGIDFCSNVSIRIKTPIIFLTVRDSEIDEVSAFRAGCHDYIKKPFSLMVLRERINSVLTRVSSGDTVYSDSRYRFDFSSFIFTADDSEVYLSTSEQKLLRTLTQNKRKILSRDKLTELMWSCDSEFIDENALSVTVRRLRSKLGNDCIKTVYGLGYMWTGDGK